MADGVMVEIVCNYVNKTEKNMAVVSEWFFN